MNVPTRFCNSANRRTALAAALVLSICAAPATAQPTGSAVLDLPFSAFFKRPVGPRGLELSDAVRQADGRFVRLTGFMVVREDATPGRFQLAPLPIRMSEHADGDADDLPPATVTVLLDPSQSARVIAHRQGPLALQGQLQVGRAEDAQGRVSWFRLQLEPDALAPRPEGAAMPARTPTDRSSQATLHP